MFDPATGIWQRTQWRTLPRELADGPCQRSLARRGEEQTVTVTRKSPTKSQIINFKLLDLLPTMTPDQQLEVFERVIKSSNPAVRPRALGLGAAILTNSRLLEYLREEDDVRRNAAVEILKLRRQRSLNLACYLLDDDDPNVVLQAVLVLNHLRDRNAVDQLIKVLDHRDANVVQEAIVALGRIGDARALPYVRPFLNGEPWLQAASIEAMGRLGSAEIVGDLAELLPDPLLGPLATEALAKIGGVDAVRALVEHWLELPEEWSSESNLQKLADMLEGLTSTPPQVEGVEKHLEEQAREGDKEIRVQAARCLVALRGSNRGLWMF
jgi:HEAT repeat protein